MKNTSIKLEILIFVLICAFLIFPPFFTPAVTVDSFLFDWSFPVKQLSLCIFALVLYFLLDKYLAVKASKFFFPSLISLGSLLAIAFLIKFIVSRFNFVMLQNPLPHGKIQIFFCILTFLLSALYEEIIYRFYLPGEIIRLFKFKFDSPFFLYLGEFLALAAFSFAHLYLGWFSVINAFAAHIILRLLYRYTGCIWNCVIVHFFYNIISLILL